MKAGLRFTVIDMEHAGGDRTIELDTPEEHIDLAVLLRDENRFGIRAIHHRTHPDQQVVSVSTDRLHTVAGEHKGKDDPMAIMRTQGIFPAPEEVSEGVDMFASPVWDETRLHAHRKAHEMRRQGFVGPAILPTDELEYSAFRTPLKALEERFSVDGKQAEQGPAREQVEAGG